LVRLFCTINQITEVVSKWSPFLFDGGMRPSLYISLFDAFFKERQ
jgi:hypothetical protein